MKNSSPQRRKRIRSILGSLIFLGILLIPIGPMAYQANEGFGDPPGPLSTSLWWRAASYVLCSAGAFIAIAAATALTILDRSQKKK